MLAVFSFATTSTLIFSKRFVDEYRMRFHLIFHFAAQTYLLQPTRRPFITVCFCFISVQWQTVPQSSCEFPYYYGGNVYCYCRHIYSDDAICGADYYTCPVAGNRSAFCIPDSAGLMNGRLTFGLKKDTETIITVFYRPQQITSGTYANLIW